MTRRFQFVKGTSRKFWEIEVKPSAGTTKPWVQIRRWGRIGQTPTSKEFFYSYQQDAQQDANKLCSEKTREGYIEVIPEPAKPPPVAGITSGAMLGRNRTQAPAQPATPKQCSDCKTRVASSGTQSSSTPLCSACIAARAAAKTAPKAPDQKDKPMDRFQLIELD